MPLFHIGGSGWANVGWRAAARRAGAAMIDPAALLDTIERAPDHQRVPGAGGAADDVRRAGRRRPRLLRLRLHRRTAPRRSPTAVLTRALRGVPAADLFQVYGLTETTGAITQLRAERPRPRRAAAAPAALGRQAVPLGRDEGRRPGDRRRRARPARSARSGPGRGRTAPATGASPRRPPQRSTPTAGCTPATPATSTTRASCSSPTGSRT